MTTEKALLRQILSGILRCSLCKNRRWICKILHPLHKPISHPPTWQILGLLFLKVPWPQESLLSDWGQLLQEGKSLPCGWNSALKVLRMPTIITILNAVQLVLISMGVCTWDKVWELFHSQSQCGLSIKSELRKNKVQIPVWLWNTRSDFGSGIHLQPHRVVVSTKWRRREPVIISIENAKL